MKSVGCLRPAVCSQQLATFSAVNDPFRTHRPRVALLRRPSLGGLSPGSSCQLPYSSARKVALTVTAARRYDEQVRL